MESILIRMMKETLRQTRLTQKLSFRFFSAFFFFFSLSISFLYLAAFRPPPLCDDTKNM